MQVVWFRDWALNARFRDIFEPVNDGLLNLREARWSDYLLLDRPRRRNLFIPRVPQRWLFDDCIYEQTITPRKQSGFDFAAWLQDKRCYMSCYQEFDCRPIASLSAVQVGVIRRKTTLYKDLFEPVLSIKSIISDYENRFSDHTIGMHIRRTDNAEAIRRSPTRLFIEAARREKEACSGLRIFLATDSEEVKREFQDTFGDSVITSRQPADRGSVEGIKSAVAEMWTLASTRKIYGSAGSSYSTMAASVGQTTVEILSVPNQTEDAASKASRHLEVM